jgi:hypothetical protein
MAPGGGGAHVPESSSAFNLDRPNKRAIAVLIFTRGTARLTMTRMLLAALAAVAAMTFARWPARAAEPAWCLITTEGVQHCRYDSLDACLRDRRGSAICNPNPAYRGAEQRRHPR